MQMDIVHQHATLAGGCTPAALAMIDQWCGLNRIHSQRWWAREAGWTPEKEKTSDRQALRALERAFAGNNGVVVEVLPAATIGSWAHGELPDIRRGRSVLLLFVDWYFSGNREGHALVIEGFVRKKGKAGTKVVLARVHDPTENCGPTFWTWPSLAGLGFKRAAIVRRT